jgi:chemotaxis protein MotB
MPAVEEKKAGAPAWMVSFGDMMTLILTFFILLVSLSKEQQAGLIAKGVGSFLVALRSFGLPSIMDDSDKESIFREVRMRFNLPPEDDPERRAEHENASSEELVRAQAAHALQPHDELNQPAVATFADGSAELTEAARRYLDLVAPTFRPLPGQLLLLEGHARDAGARFGHDDRWLAFARARAVARYLIDEHDYVASRVEARAWMTEIDEPGPATRRVDARLVIPVAPDSESR